MSETKSKEYLDELSKIYSQYPEIAGAELEKIDILTRRMDELKDPEWIAFRENEVTLRLYRHSVAVYKASCRAMQSDDGSLSREDRIKLHMSRLWAIWFIKSLGGDPKKIKDEVEREIERFAESAGIKGGLSTTDI